MSWGRLAAARAPYRLRRNRCCVSDPDILRTGHSTSHASGLEYRPAEALAEDHPDEMNTFAIAADHVFDGWRMHDNAFVVIEGSQIAAVRSQSELPANLPTN